MNEVTFPKDLKEQDIILTGRHKNTYGTRSEEDLQHKKMKLQGLFYRQ